MRLSMVQKLWLTISCIAAVTMLSIYAFSLYAYERLYVDNIKETLIQESRRLAAYHAGDGATFSARVEAFNEISGAEVLFVSNPRDLSACLPFDVQYASLITEADRQQLLQDEPVTKIGYEARFDRNIMGVVVPIVENKQLTGVLYSYVLLKSIRTLVFELGWILAPLVLLLLIITAWIGRRIVLAITRPLLQMERVSYKMSQGDFSERIAIASHDEVGRLAAAFNSMADALEHEDVQRKEFLANVSHELRTPLSYMKGYSEAILDRVIKPEEQEKFIRLMQKEADRMQRLVRDLLHLAQLEGQDFPLHRQPIVFAQLVEDVLVSYELQLREKGLQLIQRLNPDSIIYGDEDRLQQVVRNVLDNAMRYTPAGGTITVEMQSERGRCRLRIADTGIGIAPGHVAHLGERFYRADKARSRQSGGTGLGLAIVKKIVALHEGTLHITSEEQVGTSVMIELPEADI